MKKSRLVIEAGQTEKQYWRDLWQYRELFYFLSWRDILVRYKQTAIGIAWALIRPFLTMIVFTVLFSNLANLPTQEDTPYPILVLAALLPWQFFAASLGQTSQSLVSNANLISKIYFPRLLVPASAIAVNFVDLLVSGMLLLGVMIWYQYIPTWRILTLPFFVSIAALAAFGVGLWFAAIYVRFRDVAQVIPFLIQLGQYVSPVGYSVEIIPAQWRLLYSLNPMVGVIDGFRWAILKGEPSFYLPGFVLALGVVVLLVWTGIRYFRSVERTFADII
ncbi:MULTISPECIES: ABC transporter permease [Leptolyngbya]|jgi:lipopolysaccharide transport system permease protein|uniref:Transport permease protein n=2 Tax=Leptolyngbya boryana TaxID=1184 RepID=A0A1Z4JDF0_LEPBY|nr:MULTISPECIES: ABC transporter permease [Leptolyngbya]BAY54779.1 ABC-2 type transporter superfamily protein [Leptolyngbya boryana NIES-2135]MBD1854090.1 ABC transporter permease [Leptolyngbya sp. FACHB-1624]MBD2365762.1 ABC transporter permease [Leptolyngbya sp. FACHB-161]MBD2371942.1 ABC transporter permease [Leptolyngbya sp. FACHB-238]MBD2396367.1 ABC transporter permease [Leptolyngbya sp. FACHB-239]